MVQKGPKMGKMGFKTTQTRTRNDDKTRPKRSQSDPKMTPDQPKNGPKSPQNGPILVAKRSQNGPLWPQIGSNMAQKRSKKAKKNENPFKMHVDLHKSAYKHSESTQITSRHTQLLHTFIGRNVDFDWFLSKTSVL